MSATPVISVVVATYNRHVAVERLLAQLAAQDLDPRDFEVIVVDDGSDPPVAPRLAGLAPPWALRVLAQRNAGPAAARHAGVLRARGELLVFVDDDMQVGPGFLAAHRREHAQRGRCAVLGLVEAATGGGRLPLFERFHLRTVAALARAARDGHAPLPGTSLYTGNVSLRRADYLAAGGFDLELRRSEDRDLGIKLQRLGVPLCFSEAARSLHGSDHDDREAWLERSRRYGGDDLRVHERNAGAAGANPWRYLFLVSPLSRPLLAAVLAWPPPARRVSRAVMRAAEAIDDGGLSPLALRLATLAYGVEYFAGLREASGSAGRALRDLAAELQAGQRRPDAARALGAAGAFLDAVAADRAVLVEMQRRYRAGDAPAGGTAALLVEKIGFQMAAAVRAMQVLRDAGMPRAARAASRLIRHLYGAEIHWDARIAPGVCIVHGVGLVVSRAARVDAGCVLFHNVTLGESQHPGTGQRGAPHLQAGVHVGPGCTLLGPITVGAGSKLMAGAVLTESVPPRSVVRPAAPVVGTRGAPLAPAAAAQPPA